MEMFNLALLARQAWRLLIKPDSLCARLLKTIYFQSDDIINVELGSNPSKTWRAICDGLEVLKEGLIKRIGDCKSTNIWTCNWLPIARIMRPLCAKEKNPPPQLSELIDHTSMTWKVDLIQRFFFPMDVQAILQIPLG
jgi:hypothetical protein